MYEAYLQSEQVGGSVLNMNHEKQLTILLATSEKHQVLINDWCTLFAEQHGLDYQKAYEKSLFLRRKYQFFVLIKKVWRVLNSIVVSYPSVRNIHEASIAANIIMQAPSRSDSIKFLIGRLIS